MQSQEILSHVSFSVQSVLLGFIDDTVGWSPITSFHFLEVMLLWMFSLTLGQVLHSNRIHVT